MSKPAELLSCHLLLVFDNRSGFGEAVQQHLPITFAINVNLWRDGMEKGLEGGRGSEKSEGRKWGSHRQAGKQRQRSIKTCKETEKHQRDAKRQRSIKTYRKVWSGIKTYRKVWSGIDSVPNRCRSLRFSIRNHSSNIARYHFKARLVSYSLECHFLTTMVMLSMTQHTSIT